MSFEEGENGPYFSCDVELCDFWTGKPEEVEEHLTEVHGQGEDYVEGVKEKFGEFKAENTDQIPPELRKRLEKRIFDKEGRSNWDCNRKLSKEGEPFWDPNTKFVTFIKNIELGDEKVEFKDCYELPEELADKLIDEGVAVQYGWRCGKCGKIYRQKSKPNYCSNEECDGKKKHIDSVHPTKGYEMGDALLDNYLWATPTETIDETKPGLLHIYRNGVYRNDIAKGYLEGKAKLMNHVTRQAKQRHALNHVTDKRNIPEDAFGISGPRRVVKDGILNLETLEVKPHDPNALALSKIDIEHDPEAECPKFKEFLKETIPSKKDRELIQEVLGTALVNEKLHKKGVMIPGPTDAGKSTLCEIIRGVFGKDSVTNQTPKSIADSDWARARLRDVLLNISDETSSGQIYRTDRLKKALDGNPLLADVKYANIFEFEPICEHIYGTNMTPTVNRSDEAFWNRWIVASTRKEPVPENEQDPNLDKKILEKEKKGIFNWIIKGYKRYMGGEQGFSHSIDWTEERDEWLNYGDSIQRFIQRCLYYDEENKIKASELHGIFRDFVSQSKSLSVQSQNQLTREVKKLSYVAHSNKFRFEGKQSSGFKHLGVKTDFGNDGGTSQRLSKYREQERLDNGDKEEINNRRNVKNHPQHSQNVEKLGTPEEKEKSERKCISCGKMTSNYVSGSDGIVCDECAEDFEGDL